MTLLVDVTCVRAGSVLISSPPVKSCWEQALAARKAMRLEGCAVDSETVANVFFCFAVLGALKLREPDRRKPGSLCGPSSGYLFRMQFLIASAVLGGTGAAFGGTGAFF